MDETENTVELDSTAEDAEKEFISWWDRFIPNSKFSRDTVTYNRLHHAAAEIKSALGSIKE